MTDESRVTELEFSEDGERWYLVERKEGSADHAHALVKRHGNTEEMLTCSRCGVTRNMSFGCVDIEAVARSQYMTYEEGGP